MSITPQTYTTRSSADAHPSAEQETRSRRAAKASNTYGSPIVLKSKLLAACLDPRAPSSAIFVAESAGCVRRVTLDVNNPPPPPPFSATPLTPPP